MLNRSFFYSLSLSLTAGLLSWFVGGCQLDQTTEMGSFNEPSALSEPILCPIEFFERVAEACNGFDDDCDGTVDEHLSDCSGGDVADASAHCDSLCCRDSLACPSDMMCHFHVDELGRCEPPCLNGSFRLCGFGCTPEFQECVDDVWQPCTAPRQRTEQCNGLDDDCDGMTDESDICEDEQDNERLDGGLRDPDDSSLAADSAVSDFDALVGISDADLIVDDSTAGDAALDDASPQIMSCRAHSQCEVGHLCLRQQCQLALPGDFNLILVSAKVGEGIGDSWSFGLGGDPDLFADVSSGDQVIGMPSETVDNVRSVTWNHRVRLRLTIEQPIEVCVWDYDGALRGDNDLAGCVAFTSDQFVEAIRLFRGSRIRENWALLRPQPTRGEFLEQITLHIDRLE